VTASTETVTRSYFPRMLNNAISTEKIMQGVSKRALQRYSKCYSVASVTKPFTLEGL
jgi:hypothetical protein